MNIYAKTDMLCHAPIVSMISHPITEMGWNQLDRERQQLVQKKQNFMMSWHASQKGKKS